MKKPLRMTVSNLSTRLADNQELLERLLNKKSEIDGLASIATELFRKAAVAKSNADIAIAKHTLAVQDFLLLAGEGDDQIAREPSAMPPYFNGKGELCVDIPFTQREQRMAMRLAHKNLERQAESVDADDDDLFDHGDEEQS